MTPRPKGETTKGKGGTGKGFTTSGAVQGPHAEEREQAP